MNHTSGLRDGSGYSEFLSQMVNEKSSLKDLFQENSRFYTADMFSDEAPGVYFTYCNSAWGIIGSIIESVSQMKFDDFMRERVFKPLNMEADFNPTKLDLSQLATLYRFDSIWIPQVDDYTNNLPTDRVWEGYKPGTNGLLFGPQGSLRCSASDLIKLGQLFLNNGRLATSSKDSITFLKQSTLNFLSSEVWSYNGENGDTWSDFWQSYGLGLHLITGQKGKDEIFPGKTFQGHAGIAYGLLSDLYWDANSNSGVVFITNGSKRHFSYGEKSAFYAVEEDFFDALEVYINSRN